MNNDVALHLPGIPLPLIGMAAYGLVAALGLQLISKNLPFGINKYNAQLLLLASTTSMAAASAYFLYILSTKFSGSSCSYCLLSAFLSFSLFSVTIKVCYLVPICVDFNPFFIILACLIDAAFFDS